MIGISKRLKMIANTIETDSVCDIGTDHGYIPIFAVKHNLVKKAIACDVNKEPLEIGKVNIEYHNLTNKITTRLSNGFENVKMNETESAVIAGMGGLLICNILNKNITVTQSFKQIVLQPQQNTYDVRKLILTLGFFIKEEKFVFEHGKYYNILNCINLYGNKISSNYLYNEKDFLLGKNISAETKNVYKDYLKYTKDKSEEILGQINCNSNNSNKINELTQKIKWCEEKANES